MLLLFWNNGTKLAVSNIYIKYLLHRTAGEQSTNDDDDDDDDK